MRGYQFQLFTVLDAVPPHAGLNARLTAPALSGGTVDPATMLAQRAGPVVPLGETGSLSRDRLRPHDLQNPDEISQTSILSHSWPGSNERLDSIDQSSKVPSGGGGDADLISVQALTTMDRSSDGNNLSGVRGFGGPASARAKSHGRRLR